MNSEINSSNDGKLICNKDANAIHWEKIIFSTGIDRTIGHLEKR